MPVKRERAPQPAMDGQELVEPVEAIAQEEQIHSMF